MSAFNDGDFYIDSANGDFYLRKNHAWVLEGNLRGGASGVGPPGPPGANGANGTQGPPGNDGSDGIDGDPGVPGARGVDGAQGPSGAPGAPGADGIIGRDGTQGPPGNDGSDGQDGDRGAPGADGIIGRDGTQGPPGNDGLDGDDGFPGAPGVQGAQGVQGVQGIQGFQGPPGNDGLDGDDGQPGPAGAAGATGATGAAGTTGAQGAFRADKNSISQAVTAQTYTKCTATNEVFDNGGYYDAANSKWTPPAGFVTIEAGITFVGGPYTASAHAIGIYKNGAKYAESVGINAVGANPARTVAIVDQANGTDFYELWAQTPALSSGTANFAGDPIGTFFTGALLGAGPTGPQGVQGPPGVDGADGQDGDRGRDGFVVADLSGTAAPTGAIGEVISQTPSVFNLSSGSTQNVAQITLTPGTWLLSAGALFQAAATTSITQHGVSIGTTSATFNNQPGFHANHFMQATVPTNSGNNQPSINVPPILVLVTTSTVYFAVCLATFTASTLGVLPTIRAVRIR